MTKLDSIFKSRDITLPTKDHLVKAMVFPVVMYGCESWTLKKAEHQKIDAFEMWCWRRLLRDSWTARRSNQSILKVISPGCSLEGLMLRLKFQSFGYLMWRSDLLEKTLMLDKIEVRRRRGWQRMRWLDGITDSMDIHLCAGSWHIAYWVHIAYCILSAALSQHNLSGSWIAQLEVYHCQEPAWRTPPVAKVMRKEAWHTQRRDRASGVPLEILEHLPPKPESAYFLLCALTYTSDFMGGCPPLPLSEKRVNLQLQLIIPGCDSVSTNKILWKSSSLPE